MDEMKGSEAREHDEAEDKAADKSFRSERVRHRSENLSYQQWKKIAYL